MEASSPAPASLGSRRRLDRLGDRLLYGFTGVAALGTIALVGLLVYKVLAQAWPAITHWGIGFLVHGVWDPNKQIFGALDFIYGTLLTSFFAVLIAGPISIAIGLYLSELAPRGIRGIVGSLVEMLAAVPSVVIGLWGILVLGPFVANHLEPGLNSALGRLPFFSGDPEPAGYLPAIIVLTIMVVPITSSIARDLFLSVPRDLEEGALALGLTRWEMVRGVVLPYTRAGVIAAVILGLGRALGEAIAVTQTIGAGNGFHLSLFHTGDTLASRIAATYAGASSKLELSSLVYLAAILLVITLVTNIAARTVVNRFAFERVSGR